MNCSFVNELSKLRKLSIESIDNTDSFGDFQKYMHVERDVERDLRALIDSVQSKPKCLILLCGSAGDGKSHLLSYLKQNGYLEGYDIYNDATESSSPKMTALETLSIKLSSFNDANINDENAKKIIVAVNLGTLNNFIESKYGSDFTVLRSYVDKYHLLASGSPCPVPESSLIRHISFSDYQMFSLTEDGVESAYIDELFDRVFAQSPDNPFYACYLQNDKCNACNECPIRFNYEFLFDEQVRSNIRNRIIEVIVKDKEIVSTREILNFIYDLLVHPDLNSINVDELMKQLTNEDGYFQNFLNRTTPMLLDEFPNVSNFIDSIRKYDPLLTRKDISDTAIIKFNSEEDVWQDYKKAINSLPYRKLTDSHPDMIKSGSTKLKAELKRGMLKFIFRLNYLISDQKVDEDLSRYLSFLYYYNKGNSKQMISLVQTCKEAVMKWNGEFDSSKCCIDDTRDFYILEDLNIVPMNHMKYDATNTSVKQFRPTMKLVFASKSNKDKKVEIIVDYDLYRLFCDVNKGYHPTSHDKNQYADFTGFVKKLQDLGDLHEEVIIASKCNVGQNRIKFSEFDDGQFEVEWC